MTEPCKTNCWARSSNIKEKTLNDKVLANYAFRVGQGSIVGTLFSAVLKVAQRSKPFPLIPIFLGLGYGIGVGKTEARMTYNSHYYEFGDKLSITSDEYNSNYGPKSLGQRFANSGGCSALKKIKGWFSRDETPKD